MNEMDESLNASQILHLALQKMDGIIAVTSDSEAGSLTSSENISHHHLHQSNSSLSTNGTLKNNHKTANNNNNGHVREDPYCLESHIKIINQKNNQDKLNRLLAELKEYSLDGEDTEMAEVVVGDKDKVTGQDHHQHHNGNNIHQNANNNNNNTLDGTAAAPSESSFDVRQQQHQHQQQQQQQQQHQSTKTCSTFDKSSTTTPDFFSSTGDLPKQQLEREEQQQLRGPADPLVDILRNQLLNTEELFRKALLSKKTLETANQSLLGVVDKLKLELQHSDARRKLLDDHRAKVELEHEQLKTRLLEKETEISSLRLTLAKVARATGYTLSANELELLRGNTIASDFIKNKYLNYAEVSPKTIMSTSMPSDAFYSEPSSRRESYSNRACSPPTALRFYSNQPSPAATPPGRVLKGLTKPPGPMLVVGEDGVKQPMDALRSSSVENMKTLDCGTANDEARPGDLSPSAAGYDTQLHQRLAKSPYSTLPHSTGKALRRQLAEADAVAGRSGPAATSTPFKLSAHSLVGGQQQQQPQQSTSAHPSPSHHPNGVTFAKDDELIPLPASLQSSQAELRSRNEPDDDDENAAAASITFKSKPKGLRRIFSRKRSTNSLSGIADAFTRGGMRATSGPRLTEIKSGKRFENINIPFAQWDNNLVAEWLATIGLGMYVGEWRNWLRDGGHLMRATAAEVEKDFGVRNPLHRKKLRLAVAGMLNDDEDELLKSAGRLDFLWVARWLDDIGLPQYKDAFIDARVDGRVLHYLTVEDLFNLKVISQLHFASIRSGIRILRENKYNGQCLKRRATADEAQQTSWRPEEVSLWTSHRVMEWLRSIDLSEYAPNLRGSGVHGSLILFENAFNSDLFATLLSIPTSKTLLRRHIATKFRQLIGDDLHRIKMDFEHLPNYQPMIPGSKVKAYKKGHFTLRKKRSDYELTDYVCPMGPVGPNDPRHVVGDGIGSPIVAKRAEPGNGNTPDKVVAKNEVKEEPTEVSKSDTEVDQAVKNGKETLA